MKKPKKIVTLWNSLPFDYARGALKGQMIRLTNPARYRQLKAIRPDRKKLVLEKNLMLGNISKTLRGENVPHIKIYGRVKTLGSLDRKEKYAMKIYSGKDSDFYIHEDLIGITVIVQSPEHCYLAVESLKKIGRFPNLGFRDNPRDYINAADRVSRPEVKDIRDAIIGNFIFNGFHTTPVHLKIMTKKSRERELLGRHAYKKRLMKKIKE